MKTVLQLMIPENETPLLVLENPPVVPGLGDLIPGPDSKVYQVVQRAYIVDQATPKLEIVGATQNRGRIIIECVLVEVEMTAPEKN